MRSWATHYRGPLVICATANPKIILENGEVLPAGCAIAVVELVDCRPFEQSDCKAAMISKKVYKNYLEGKKLYAWVLRNPRTIKPVSVKCKRKLFKEYLNIEYE